MVNTDSKVEVCVMTRLKVPGDLRPADRLRLGW
jgi:hypothetical protein